MRKKYEYAEFTRGYYGSVGKILSKFNAFIFFFAVLVYTCKLQNVCDKIQNCEILINIFDFFLGFVYILLISFLFI